MVQLTEFTWAPEASIEPHDLERLKILDWDDVHESIQAILQKADQYVCKHVPRSGVTVSKTRSRSSFALFSYHTYQAPDNAIDPVVLGVTFQPIPEGVRITGDIAGESIGDVLFETGPKEVADEYDDVSCAASLISRCLIEKAELIVQAIQDKNRLPKD